jgi:hypothetical protein
MTISTIAHTIKVTEVADVLVTEVEQDGGEFLRDIRILAADEAVVFTLRLSADAADKIKFTTPELDF